MTENEVIKKSIEVFEKPSKHIKCVHKCENGMEFLTYSQDLVLAFETAIDCLEEIQQYRAIGTVEECREARERKRAKKPIKTPDCSGCEKECNKNCISFNYGETYLCPTCNQNAIFNSEYDVFYKHCKNCGQAVDWSDTD